MCHHYQKTSEEFVCNLGLATHLATAMNKNPDVLENICINEYITDLHSRPFWIKVLVTEKNGSLQCCTRGCY